MVAAQDGSEKSSGIISGVFNFVTREIGSFVTAAAGGSASSVSTLSQLCLFSDLYCLRFTTTNPRLPNDLDPSYSENSERTMSPTMYDAEKRNLVWTRPAESVGLRAIQRRVGDKSPFLQSVWTIVLIPCTPLTTTSSA